MAAAGPPPAVVMNPLDATLDILLRENGTVCSKHSEAGYGYFSGGCRANVGLSEGKAHFKVRMLQALLSSDDLPVTHTACIGVSWADAPVQQLGEADHTWGYSGTGEKASGGACMPYAEPFGPGDEVTCILDLTAAEPTLTFAKNGVLLGVAHKLPRPSGPAQAFFPHVLIKNVEVKLDFGGSNPSTSSAWHDKLYDCPSWQAAVNGGAKRVVIPSAGVACNECEVLMLVGLPGTGKTTWARQRAEKLPARRYMTLGTDLVMEQMKVPGLQLHPKSNSAGGFHGAAGLDVATLVLQSLLDRAPAVPRNYILDQRNVDESARKRRLAPFLRAGFTCRAIVFITPDRMHFGRQRWLFTPEDKVVPDEALAEMKAHFSIPIVGPEFKEVTYAEDSGAIAAQVVEQKRAAGRAWLHWHKRSLDQGQEQQRATQVRKLQPGMTPRGHGQPLSSKPPGCGQVPPSVQGLSAAAEPQIVPDWHMLLQSFPKWQGRGLYGQRQLGPYGQQWPYPGQQGQGLCGQQWPYPGQQGQGPFGQPFLGPYGQQWSGPCPGQQWQGPYGQLQQGPHGQLQQGSYGQEWPGPYPGMQGPYRQQGQGSNPGLQRPYSGQQWQGPYEQQRPYGQQGQGTYGQQWLGPDRQQMPYPGMQGQGYHAGQQGQCGQQDCSIGSKAPGSAAGGAAGGAGAAGRPAAEEPLEEMELFGARQGAMKQDAQASAAIQAMRFMTTRLATVAGPGAVSFPLGVHLPGDATHGRRKLFVRKTFPALFDAIVAKAPVLLTGTPGVGKTWFLNYFIWRLVQEEDPPVIVWHGKQRCLLIEGNKVLSVPGSRLGVECFEDKLQDRRAWYVVDGGAEPLLDTCAKYLVVTSGASDSYKRYKKEVVPNVLYMSRWTSAELKQLCEVYEVQEHAMPAKLEEMYGPHPRHVVESVALHEDWSLSRLTQALKLALSSSEMEPLLKLVGRKDTICAAGHELLHIDATAEAGFMTPCVMFASDYVRRQLPLMLTNSHLDQVRLTIDTLKSEAAFSSVRAVLFEALCQRVLSDGGTFEAAAVCGQQLTSYAAAGVSLTQQGSSWQLHLPAAHRLALGVHDEAGAAGPEQEAEGPHVCSMKAVAEPAAKPCWYEHVAAAVQQLPNSPPGGPAVNLYLMPLAQTSPVMDALRSPGIFFQVTVSTTCQFPASEMQTLMSLLPHDRQYFMVYSVPFGPSLFKLTGFDQGAFKQLTVLCIRVPMMSTCR